MKISRNYLDLISGKSRGPLATLGRFALLIASGSYFLVIILRNKLFDWGLKKQHSVSVPVISIGNCTTGGTGKTPMVEYVARHFRNKGLRVSILSRGYGANEQSGMNDEGLLLEQNLPDVPHLQGTDRVSLASIAVDELESEILVLDDGLQHRRLERNANIVLIDASNPFGYGWVLPRGLLREPLSMALKRADLVVLTRSDMVTEPTKKRIFETVNRLRRPPLPVVESIHKPTSLIALNEESIELDSLKGKKVAIFCGLGNPSAFRKTVESLGAIVTAELFFPDHHMYAETDIATLSRWVSASDADLALTSQKDLVKLPVDHLGGRPLYALRISLEITSGQKALTDLLDQTIQDRVGPASF